MKILIVEDNEESKYFLETLLKSAGYEVTAVSNGKEAFEFLNKDSYDLIISDILMPVMNGFELCRRVKRDDVLRKIPLIVYTATYTDPKDEEYVLKLGADRFILKPCEPEDILRTIDEVIAASKNKDISRSPVLEDEESYKLYSERLVKKLEDKMVQLRKEIDTRKEIEIKLRDSLNLWQTTFDSMLDPVSISDSDGTVKQCNKAFADFVGLKITDIIGQKCYKIVHKTDSPVENCPILRSMESKKRETSLLQIDEKNFYVVVDPIWSDGQITGFVHIIRDITELKKTEDTLRRSEARYRRLYESMMDGFIYIDMQGFIKECNETFLKMLGYTFEEISGVTYIDLTPEKWLAFEQKIVEEQILPRGYSDVYEKEYRKKDGTILPVELRTFLIKNEQGENEGMWAIVRDITERKKSEAALRESEERFRELFDNAPVGYHEIDKNGNIVRVNQTEADMLGYKREEMIGKPIWNFMVDGENIKGTILSKISGEIYLGKDYERKYIRKDGTILDVLQEDRLIKDKDGNITGLRVTIQDISNLKKIEKEKRLLEEQLIQSQKLESIGKLAGGIAHDFNNILTAIKGNAQLALMKLHEEDPLFQKIKNIIDASDRAASLIKQLLAFSRKQILEPKVIDINELIRNIEKMIVRLIGEDIELSLNLTENIAKVKVDPSQTEQALINLIVNAREAMPKGGKLTIETSIVELTDEYVRKHIGSKAGRYVIIAVTDTGVGMTEEVRDRCFEPFFTTKESGTGLGLPTVYGIVKQSGGNIWVYSEVGKGTTFKIYLPLVEEPLDYIKKEVYSIEIPKGNETILLVEDDENVRKTVSSMLQSCGYKVLVASSGNEAISFCKEYGEPINLIITDVIMPGLSGAQVAEAVRQICPKAKVLFMSGYTDNVVFHHSVLEKGINFIQKPFSLKSLSEKIREVLGKKTE